MIIVDTYLRLTGPEMRERIESAIHACGAWRNEDAYEAADRIMALLRGEV